MEDNKNHYEAELRAAKNRTITLQEELTQKEEQLKKQELLMEEMYKLIYYKRAWLSLSDDNVEGMKKVIDNIPKEERIVPSSQVDSGQLELGFDEETWGI